MTDSLVQAIVGNSLREPLASFEEAWASWAKSIGMQRDRYKPVTRRPVVGTQKIVVIPDIHAPFHEEKMLAALIARERDADVAVCIGDVSDAYSLSTFTKYRSMPFAEEWASVTAVMQAISEAFPEVRVIVGNHDARMEKRLRERLSEDMVDAVRYLAGGILCPLTALAQHYPNVTVANHLLSSGDSADWFTTIGDAWFGHPERYSRVPGSALRSVEDWLSDHEDDLELGRFRLIVMGHTHTYSQFPWRNRQMLVECGAICQTQGYMLKPKIGGRPQIRGYLTLVQQNGVTDLNSVRFHWLDQDRVYAQSDCEIPGATTARSPATQTSQRRRRTQRHRTRPSIRAHAVTGA